MSCDNCKSQRVADINGKTSDMCSINFNGKSHNDYVPRDMNIGGGDYLNFDLCLDCGKVQGKFPVPQTEMEAPPDEE